MSKRRANEKYRPDQIACYPAENIVLNYMFCPTGNTKKKWPCSSIVLFRLFEAITAYNAWNYNKNSRQDRGKNSLDVIGHTHTSGTVPFTHQAQWRSLRAKLWGQWVCAQSCFFHYTEMRSSMANHLSHRATVLPQACQARVFTLRRRADTWGNQKVGFRCVVTALCNMSSCQGGQRRGNLWECGSPNFLFVESSQTWGEHTYVYEEPFVNALQNVFNRLNKLKLIFLLKIFHFYSCGCLSLTEFLNCRSQWTHLFRYPTEHWAFNII